MKYTDKLTTLLNYSADLQASLIQEWENLVECIGNLYPEPQQEEYLALRAEVDVLRIDLKQRLAGYPR